MVEGALGEYQAVVRLQAFQANGGFELARAQTKPGGRVHVDVRIEELKRSAGEIRGDESVGKPGQGNLDGGTRTPDQERIEISQGIVAHESATVDLQLAVDANLKLPIRAADSKACLFRSHDGRRARRRCLDNRG